MNDLVELVCHHCGKSKHIRQTHYNLKVAKGYKKFFCDNQCQGQWQTAVGTVTASCGQCGSSVTRKFGESESSKSGHIFCNTSCAATYNNTHKTTGYRRSKLEIWLETELRREFPNLDIYTNDRSAISLELDFYFPALKLAFEFNGICHYQPIYGQERFDSRIALDARKTKECEECKIELHVIDVSTMKVFNQKFSAPHLSTLRGILKETIRDRLERGWQIDSTDPTRGLKPSNHQGFKPRKKRPMKPARHKVSLELERAIRWDKEIRAGEITQTGLSEREKISMSYVSNVMSLLKLPEEMRLALLARDEKYGRLALHKAVSMVGATKPNKISGSSKPFNSSRAQKYLEEFSRLRESPAAGIAPASTT